MSLTDETRRILELLRHHHASVDGWATFMELAEEPVGGQRLDFFALHTWRSKGYRAVAYEIKVSRADFKRELEQPVKRIYAEKISHECFFVVPRGLVLADEIPDGWGLMVADAGGLKLLKHGTQRKEVRWTPAFVASMARRSADPAPTMPKAAWKVEGREVTEAELIAIAEQTLKTTIESERQGLINQGRHLQRVEDDSRYARHAEVMRAIAEVAGIPAYQVSAHSIREWAAGMGRISGANDHNKLRTAHQLLSELLGAKP